MYSYFIQNRRFSLTSSCVRSIPENVTGRRIQILRDDKGGEYSSGEFDLLHPVPSLPKVSQCLRDLVYPHPLSCALVCTQ